MKLNGMFFYTCICTGTKCDSRKDCGAEMSCTAMESFGNKIKNCVPKLNEGAICSSCLLYTSPSPRDKRQSRMPSSA